MSYFIKTTVGKIFLCVFLRIASLTSQAPVNSVIMDFGYYTLLYGSIVNQLIFYKV